MRSLASIAVAALLGGCNMVMTTTPLFTQADEAGAPRLKPGIWSTASDASCAFDPSAPLEQWPSCANGGIVTDRAIGGYQHDANGKLTLMLEDKVLTAGEPRVIQIHVVGGGADQGLTLSGYFYGGVRVVGTDDAGRITAMTAWPVLCGPPPPDTAPTNGKLVFGTREPLPGMVMDKARNNCTTTSPRALKAAAAASEKWTPDASTSHWLRPGDH